MIDLNVHANHSGSVSTVEEVLHSAKKKDLDGIVVTVHDTIAALDDSLICNQDLIVISGVEVKT